MLFLLYEYTAGTPKAGLVRTILLLVLWAIPPLATAAAAAPPPFHNPSSSRLLPHNNNDYDFEQMSKLTQRLDLLERAAPAILMGFFDPQLHTFSATKPEGTDHQQHDKSSSNNNNNNSETKKRVCVTSTCYALLTLTLSEADIYDCLVVSSSSNTNGRPGSTGPRVRATSSTEKQPAVVEIRKCIKALVASSWRLDDLFQVPLLLYTILIVDRSMLLLLDDNEEQEVASNTNKTDDTSRRQRQRAARIHKLVTAVLQARPHRRAGVRQEHSDYIIYQICKVVALLQKANQDGILLSNNLSSLSFNERVLNTNATATTTTMSEEIFWALLRCAEVSSNELCRQLAYRTAGDSGSFDVIRLAYSLLTYLRSTDSLSNIAGRELVPGQGPSPDAVVAPFNKRSERLVKAALAAFFEEQNPNGLWDKGQPIYKSFGQGKGRNMGNAFVFPVNTVGSLLCALPAEYFRPHLSALEKTLGWIESHQTLEIIHDYCDDKTGQCYGKPLRGWASPHFDPESGPNAWSTAQVLKCVTWMKRRIRQLMHNDVLEEFHGIRYSDDGVQTSAWSGLLDSDLGDPSHDGRCRTIKSVLEERVVAPFATSITKPTYGAAYSAILFGPPGTAKTTICEALAQRMGYDFCVIDTASFLADGLSNVSARIRYVFSRLMALNKCIILFDEIEEFALDRETPGLSMESRMLTTAMLTAINDLRRNGQSVFFIATNRLRAFDSAITRPGRFDMQLFVGTPNLESRVGQFDEMLSGMVNEEIQNHATESFRMFLGAMWSQDLMYMNYLEGKNFASACAAIARSEGRLSGNVMTAILRQQAAVMTVRGSARDEYVASMELSRL